MRQVLEQLFALNTLFSQNDSVSLISNECIGKLVIIMTFIIIKGGYIEFITQIYGLGTLINFCQDKFEPKIWFKLENLTQ